MGRGVGGWSVIEDPTSGVQPTVKEALDAELDAYLDRELLQKPTNGVRSALKAEKTAERLQSVLALAAEEEQWLGVKPPEELPEESTLDLDGGACEIPEHLKVKPEPGVSPELLGAPSRQEAPWAQLPVPLPGLAVAPPLAQQGLSAPAPVAAAHSRTPWLVTGALAGVSAASVFVAAMLWMTRDAPQDPAQVRAADAAVGSVAKRAVVPATPAPEPGLFVKDSPRPREPERLVADWAAVANGTVEALPGPWVPGRAVATREPPPRVPVPAPEVVASGDKAGASGAKRPEPVKTEVLKPPEKVQARRAPAVEERQTRRQLEDPALEEEEEELPVLQPPQEARAPAVAKAEPPPAAPSEPGDGAEFDEEFARKLGFTPDAARKKPEPTAVKSVWVPPDPDASLPETLSPKEVQQVVIANQPAISSCIQRHKEAIPGVSGGKFMVRWFILPSGSTQQVAMETKALKGTALATCIEDLVRGWKFPKHRTQMGAIRFPFIF